MDIVRNRVINILDSWFGIVLLIISLFYLQMPYFFASFPFFSWSIPKGRWILILILGICFLLTQTNVKDFFRKEKILWGTVAWNLLLCISMHLQNKGLHDLYMDHIPACLLAVLILSVYSKGNIKKILLVLFLYYLIVNTANNASMLFFANTGIWIPYGEANAEYFFYGHINGGIVCAVNSLLFGCMYSHQYNKAWDMVNWVNLAYSLVAAVIARCEVQIVLYIITAAGLVLCYICSKFPVFEKILRWINLKTIMIFNLIVEVMVIPLGQTGWMELVHLDPRVHDRRELWNGVLNDIRQHPVIGQGYSSWFGAEIEGSIHSFWHQHSMYLLVAYETGIVGIAIFVYMFVVGIKELSRLANFGVRFLTGLLVGGFFLAMTVECCERSETFLMLGAIYYISKQLPQKHRERKTAC